MEFCDALGADGLSDGQPALVDPLLDRHVSFGFDRKIPLLPVLAAVVREGAFDVDGMRVVAFDEVGVVAVRHAHQAGKRYLHGSRKAAAEPGRLPLSSKARSFSSARWREVSEMRSGSIAAIDSSRSTTFMSASMSGYESVKAF